MKNVLYIFIAIFMAVAISCSDNEPTPAYSNSQIGTREQVMQNVKPDALTTDPAIICQQNYCCAVGCTTGYCCWRNN